MHGQQNIKFYSLLTSRLFVGGQDSPVLLLRVERSERDVGVARERGS